VPRKTKLPPKPGPEATPIDAALIENLAAVGCTVEEIAAAVSLTKRQLLRRLKEAKLANAIEQGRAKGRATLRGWQWNAAKLGNVTAQIWLGKQLLGQRSFEKEEKPEPIRAGSVSYQWVPRSKDASSTSPSTAKPDSTTPPADSKDSPDQ
jgi:hypothetical protein